MATYDFAISDEEAGLLIKLLSQVLTQRVFFSLGEMTTITSWRAEDVAALADGLLQGTRSLSEEDQRFMVFAFGAWFTSVRKGRVAASEAEVELAHRVHERQRSEEQRHRGDRS